MECVQAIVGESESVRDVVGRLLAENCEAWWDASSEPYAPSPRYESREQVRHEGALDRFLAALTAEAERPPRTEADRDAARRRILDGFGELARSALGFREHHLAELIEGPYADVAGEFARRARGFDPAIRPADVFQAWRNVWTMNGLQRLLGRPVRLTPSVFAYSMLYPYTDNYLDDPAIAADEKVAFSARFSERLSGREVAPRTAQEERIYRLVALIEEEYDRRAHPQVFESLLAIHRAQERSVRLVSPGAAPYEVDVLGISLEKGGTSVLADGYLVAGELTAEQAAFLFGYGALLQIVDDLQDVAADRDSGLLTVFSQSAGRWKLDRLVNRTFRYGDGVVRGLQRFGAQGGEPLAELIATSWRQLLVDAVGRSARFFSRGYVRAMERHSPFRYRPLRARRKRLSRSSPQLMRLVEAFAAADGA